MWFRVQSFRWRFQSVLLGFGFWILFPGMLFSQANGSETRKSEFELSQNMHSPRKALYRAAAVPGWGQIYNHQYYKLPFVYAAIGGLIYAGISINNKYLLYRRAFLYKAFDEQVSSGQIETNPHLNFKYAYNQLVRQFGEIASEPIRSQRDLFRRNRDFSFIGIGLAYMLSILDAYVNAQLIDFDIDENLSFSVQPSQWGWSPTVRITM